MSSVAGCAPTIQYDPNEAVILFEWDDEDPQAFFESEEMRERLADAGVKGQPELTTLKLVDQK